MKIKWIKRAVIVALFTFQFSRSDIVVGVDAETKPSIATVRLQLIKIAGRISWSARYLTFKLSSHCVYQKEFLQTLKEIQRLPGFS